MADQPETTGSAQRPTEPGQKRPDRAAFVWPPNPEPVGEADPDGPGVRRPKAGVASEPVTEPVRPAIAAAAPIGTTDASPAATRPAEQSDAPKSRIFDALRSLEQAVLGAQASALPLGWRPEPSGDACPRCAGTVGVGEADGGGCSTCRDRRLAWACAVRLGSYAGDLKSAIVACKYSADRAVGRRLGLALGERVAARLAVLGLSTSPVTVVPVPTTRRRRLRNSGLDHALVLARGVGSQLGTTPVSILRRKHGPRQAASSVAERARNVKGKFSVRTGARPPAGGVIVLVDDVRTTGATASACFRAITDAYGAAPSERGSEGSKMTNGRVREGQRPLLILATAGVSETRRAKTALTAQNRGHDRNSSRSFSPVA